VLSRGVIGLGLDEVYGHRDGYRDDQDCHKKLRQHAAHIRLVAGITHTMPRIR
jgi:hypothetical protein